MTDWSIVNTDGLSVDPVPGDPAEVSKLAQWFQRMSDDVRDSVAAIHHFDVAAGWRDQAARKFEEGLGTLRGDFPKLRDSYEKAGAALQKYSNQLSTSQQQARQALNSALEAKAHVDSAQRARQTVTSAAVAGQPPPDTSSYDHQEQDANKRLADARDLVQRACRERDHAADACMAQLVDAQNAGMKVKDWWDRVAGNVSGAFSGALSWFDHHLDEISSVCGQLSAILGVLALLTCWIPVVGEVFEAASLVTGLIAIAADARRAQLSGKKGWDAWGSVAIGAALTLAPFGIAKVLGRGASMIRVAEEEQAVSRVAGLKGAISEAKTAGQEGGVNGLGKILRHEEGLARDAKLQTWLHGGDKEGFWKGLAHDVTFKELRDPGHAAYRKIDVALAHAPRTLESFAGSARQWHDLPTAVCWTRGAIGVGGAASVHDVGHSMFHWNPVPGERGG